VTSWNISSLYFRFRPVAGHEPGCPREGTDTWEVTWYVRDFPRDETTIRLACADCGTVAFFAADGSLSTEHTHASQIGWGSRPDKVAGLWLHAGPPVWYRDDRGPTAYYVTTTPARPSEPGQAAGIVGWHTGPRGGIRWGAGLDPTDHGTVAVAAGRDFSSRRAAVAWIAAQLAARTTAVAS
jgi:hypothetical protein